MTSEPKSSPEITSDLDSPAPGARRLTTGQWSLKTILLLTTLAAILVAWWQNGQSRSELKQKISLARRYLNELVVDDPQQFAATKLSPTWYGTNEWNVHLPSGHRYQLHFAVSNIDDSNFPEAIKSIAIESGRHSIEINTNNASINHGFQLVVDRSTTETIVSQPIQKTYASSSTGINQCGQQSITQPLVLYRLRFLTPSANGSYRTATGPTEGLLVWIECID